MKKGKRFKVLGIIIVIVLLVSACSGKKDASVFTDSGTNGSVTYGDLVAPEATGNQNVVTSNSVAKAPQMAADTTANALSSTSSLSTGVTAGSQDKIIRTFNMDVETQEFDSLISKIGDEIKMLGGYVENSQVNGKLYYNNDQARNGTIVARIPSDKVDEFVNVVNDNSNVVNKQESTSNVSLQYIDTESRIETLKTEQERLLAIMDKEVNLENIITLESRLSDIQYELQNYESQLRYYDNQVSYSTVTMNIQEVEKLTPVTEKKQTVWTRIKNGFGDTMYKISSGLKDFLVWFVVNLPYLLIWALIICVIIIIIRRSMKKSRAKKYVPPHMNYGPLINAGPQPGQDMVNPDQSNQNKPD